MNVFLAALNSVVPHFRVRGHMLSVSQGHPFSRVHIDLREVAAYKLPGPAAIRLRLFRGHWMSLSTEGFRPSEVGALCDLLNQWQKQNHQKHEPQA
ncbi:MAG: hypothetical protein H0X66_11160 [Verrucomicrobia bacterium]|nr:hypothetical protein [Verrucomicrobiota bacterium]